MLADFAPAANCVHALAPTDAIGGLRALTGVGAALLASDELQDWTEATRDRRVAEGPPLQTLRLAYPEFEAVTFPQGSSTMIED